MIILTNTASQELAPGQSLIFDTTVMHTRCNNRKAECHRVGSGSVTLQFPNSIYEIDFSANVGATEPGVAQLAIGVNGSTLVETTMISTTNAAGDVNNVAKNTAVRTCCCGQEAVTITNTGTTTVVVENPSLFIKRLS